MPRQPPAPTHRITLTCEKDTADLAGRLAAVCEPGLVVGLVGGLGAGKTCLVRATAIALGADPLSISSPTFVLIQEYAARIPVYHFDTYRLRSAGEFIDLGTEEYFDSGGICFIEWADRVREALPEDVLWTEITVLGETQRLATFQATGPRSQRVLARLIAANDGAARPTDNASASGGRK